VISESSRSAKDSQCLKCQDYDHVVAQSPSRNLLVKETDGESKQSFMKQLIV